MTRRRILDSHRDRQRHDQGIAGLFGDGLAEQGGEKRREEHHSPGGRRRCPQVPALLPAVPERVDQIGRRTITFRATKSGAVVERETRLLEPLARDLRRWRLRCPPADEDLVFPSASGQRWTGSDWDNWRERIFKPTAIAVGMPRDTRPRDLRGSFASLLIYEGVDVVELAPELGHSPATCLRYYARVFEEFKGLPRCPAVDVIREARDPWRPARYLDEDPSGVGAIWHVRHTAR